MEFDTYERPLYSGDSSSYVSNHKEDVKDNSLKNQMVAISRQLARAQSKMNIHEKKLLVMCLTKIRWTRDDNSNMVELDKKEIADALGLAYDKNLSYNLRKEFYNLAIHSEIHWTDPNDSSQWQDDFLITKRKSTRSKIQVWFNQDYMPHLQNFLKEKMSFLTYWANDMYKFESKFAFALFEDLRYHYNTDYFTNEFDYTTKQLKELFGLSASDYMHHDNKRNIDIFDRSNFEKRTIQRAVDEINKGEMMKIVRWWKVKDGMDIKAYRFKYYMHLEQQPGAREREAQAELERENLQIPGQMTFDDFIEGV